MGNRIPFAEGEWYHCYSRGIDKRVVFSRPSDYARFTELLYLANDTCPVRRDDRVGTAYEAVFQGAKAQNLVSVGAYTLMPNHFHIVLMQVHTNGISKFMQKLITGYSMYYNIKYKRSGGLFTRPFRSRHIEDDRYFQYVIDYVHLNPIEHLNGSPTELVRKAREYTYSSFGLYSGARNTESPVLGKEVSDVYTVKSPKIMLESLELYQSP